MNDEAGAAPLFDAAHLAQYTLGDPALEREVLAMFFEQVAALQGQLHAAANETVWREAAHTLKGSARGVGAFRLGETAAALEQIAPALPGLDRRGPLGALSKDFHLTRAAMQRHMAAAAGEG